ncbi:MAG: PQQ-dependent sugar dehydrogenase [Patescibacteria group bacterium]|nr:PQQ-dependent sugar dehydrogenase [Patescibacteria group bacterium]
MNKFLKILLVVVIILVILFLAAFIYFYPQIGPAFLPPAQNVVNLLPNANVNINAVRNINTNAANDILNPTKAGPFTILGNFQMNIFAQGLNTPRVLLFDDAGNLLVSAMGEGKVYAIKLDGTKVVLASGLNTPHGLALNGGYLYIAETDKVSRYTYDSVNLKFGAKEFLFNLPSGGEHVTRTIQFGSDGYLYVAEGSTCNVCDEINSQRAAISRYNPKDWSYTIFASGLRNTVFFTLNPKTNQFWGNDMGRDFLGDNLPPDELNILTGGNYGWPICYGNKVNDRNFDKRIYVRDPCIDTIAPIWEYGAHNAPLGLAFINSSMFPASWQGDLLVALHGSWNSTVPVGYKVVHLKVSGNQVLSSEDFITGFLVNGGAIGRPVGLAFDKAGALYLSDDKAGVIYKIFR